jgi:trimeric autotransporter adhesin
MKNFKLPLILALSFSITLCFQIKAQGVSINSSGTAPVASSILDISSTTKGILIPRMSTAQRITIASPAIGLTVYDTGTASFWTFTPSGWINHLTNSSGWTITGNTAPTGSYIGTNNNEPLIFKVNNTAAGRIDNTLFNTLLGYESGLANTTGAYNVAIGYDAMKLNITSNSNTAVGTFALVNHRSGIYNVAIGYGAMNSDTSGAANTAVGVSAMFFNKSGHENVAIGQNSLSSNTTGSSNVAVGVNSLAANTTGINNTGLGNSALLSNVNSVDNTAVGASALESNVDGYSNTAFGRSALFSAVHENENTAVGYSALKNNTVSENTAVGAFALYSNSTGHYNTATGHKALYTNAAGEYNTAFGYQAMLTNSTGGNNTASGAGALYNNTGGSRNVAMGHTAALNNTIGNDNVAVGFAALSTNKGRSQSTAIGAYAMLNTQDSATAGITMNTAVGFEAMKGNLPVFFNQGVFNTAIGAQSMKSMQYGTNNTAVGTLSMFNATIGNYNVAVGDEALRNITSGSSNTACGKDVLHMNNSGNNNTCIGQGASYFGLLSGNSSFGFSAGTDSDNSTNCSYIGIDADNDSFTNSYSNSTALGNAARMTASNQVRIGNASVGSIGGFQNWSNVSDGRYKKDLQENVPGLDFITKLRPVTYHLDVNGLAARLHEDVVDGRDSKNNIGPTAATSEARDQKSSVLETGFVAQEVEATAKSMGYDFSGVDAPVTADGLYGLRYATFVVPLVKAVQEQQVMIISLQKENAELKDEFAQKIAALEERMKEIEKKQ